MENPLQGDDDGSTTNGYITPVNNLYMFAFTTTLQGTKA